VGGQGASSIEAELDAHRAAAGVPTSSRAPGEIAGLYERTKEKRNGAEKESENRVAGNDDCDITPL